MMAWIHFSETNLAHCFTLTNQLGNIYPNECVFLKPRVLLVPYTFISKTFTPSNLSSSGIGLR